MERSNWDEYYESPFPAAKYTRRLSANLLVALIRKFAPTSGSEMTVAELGGANSAFLDRIRRCFHPREYHVIDISQAGLDMVSARFPGDPKLFTHHADVLHLDLDIRVDVAFSVGLVEHFDQTGTRKAIGTHFNILHDGGVAILSYPTPTWLYRLTRGAAELLGIWKFPDERPLRKSEVIAALPDIADVCSTTVNWPIVLTQEMMVAKKRVC